VRAEVRTSRGQLEFTLDRKAAPCAVASFLSLAAQGFYDRTQCHRLTTGPTLFVLTCGDPSGTGGGGPGYSFGVELTGKEKYVQGVLALVNRGANTNGSQFLIVYRDSQLPASYTIFGRVTSGLGVVQKVAAGGALSGADGKPKFPVSLLQISPVA
jgi:peptidyl-prolyl cis-trans isomerase B (cyclophilin B)